MSVLRDAGNGKPLYASWLSGEKSAGTGINRREMSGFEARYLAAGALDSEANQ
jgi:hypothetical protein